jgi:hypothetical protein
MMSKQAHRLRTALLPLAPIFMSVVVMAQIPASTGAGSAMSPAAPALGSGRTQIRSQPQGATSAEAARIQAASLSAELTKSLDTKKAKTGDQVTAQTTSDAKLPSGAVLPKGTKLLGSVIEVSAKSKEQKSSHLVISLNRAVIKDGEEMPIHAAITSISARALPQSPDMPLASSGGMTPGTSPTTGSAASGAPMPTSQSIPETEAQVQRGGVLRTARDKVPVGNMPNVMLSAPTTADSAAVLDAENQNISLQSGTTLTVNVSLA